MTEEDFIAANGSVEHTGQASPAAQKWADIMTQKYPELAVADPIFRQLQNCMELAVVGAIVVKNHLPEKAGYDLPTLLNSPAITPYVFNTPKQVPTIASTKGGWSPFPAAWRSTPGDGPTRPSRAQGDPCAKPLSSDRRPGGGTETSAPVGRETQATAIGLIALPDRAVAVADHCRTRVRLFIDKPSPAGSNAG